MNQNWTSYASSMTLSDIVPAAWLIPVLNRPKELHVENIKFRGCGVSVVVWVPRRGAGSLVCNIDSTSRHEHCLNGTTRASTVIRWKRPYDQQNACCSGGKLAIQQKRLFIHANCATWHLQKGTTVFVNELFKNLPVRRKELTTHSKRGLAKCVAMLQAYALILPNIKFSLANTAASGWVLINRCSGKRIC